MTIQTLAEWYYKQLKRDKRVDGKEYYKFECANKEDEERCRALALDAHESGHMLPDDWRYEFINEALGALAETDDPDEIQLEADVYTSDLTGWLHSRNDRVGYIDDAVGDGLCADDADMFTRLQLGQYMEKREVLDSVRAYLEHEAEVEEEEAEEAEEVSE